MRSTFFAGCVLLASNALAINSDRIIQCHTDQNTHQSCVNNKMLGLGLNMPNVQALCTKRCFEPAPVAPVLNAAETCAKNAIERCIDQKVNPRGVYLLNELPQQHNFDLTEMMQRGGDCAECIKSAIGASVNPETVRTAQCAAIEVCNAPSATSTCSTQSQQLYEAECECQRDERQTVESACQTAQVHGVELCQKRRGDTEFFQPKSCERFGG